MGGSSDGLVYFQWGVYAQGYDGSSAFRRRIAMVSSLCYRGHLYRRMRAVSSPVSFFSGLASDGGLCLAAYDAVVGEEVFPGIRCGVAI
jgi:hypothetical protein